MIISIDIGTSYSSISMLGPDGKPVPVDISTGASLFGSRHSLPSAVYLEDSGEILVGQAAMNSRVRKPQNFRMEFKRNLGDNYPLMIGSRSFRVEELYTQLLRHMKSCAQKLTGEKIEHTYLTYPASYGKDNQDRLRSAAKAAGLFQVELVQEPVAAAMSYYAAGYIKDGQTLLVYDFGGGTFDCAILKFENGVFRVLGADGQERCGGIDMDRLIYQDMMKAVDADTVQMLQKNQTLLLRFTGQLSELAVKVKHQLSSAQTATENIPMGWDNLAYELNRETFNRMIAPMISQTIQVCRNVLERANISSGDLSAVLMVGGTSRVPLVQDMVRQFAKNVPVHIAPNLDLAVVQGALSFRDHGASDDPEELYQKAKEMEENGKYPLTEVIAAYRRPAELGNAEAQYAMAIFTEDDNEKAYVKWLQKAADQEHAEAQWRLGRYYEAKDSPKSALFWWRKAAENHDIVAITDLGDCYAEGKYVSEDQEEAARWYLKGANQGDAWCQSEVADRYSEGRGLPQSDKSAFQWYEKSAKNEMAYSQYKLAECYDQGKGCRTDLAKAFQWYMAAAEQGDDDAQYMVGHYYSFGKHVSVDRAKAAKWYKKAAEQGNVAAQLFLGACFADGTGVSQNWTEAAKWYRKAAEQGNAEAQYLLGLCYECGTGTPRNLQEAVNWYIKAANQGHEKAALSWYLIMAKDGDPAAQYNLALCYYHGEGTAKNLQEAVKWYRKAAEQGDAEAQYNLALCYETGEGTAPNIQEAMKWYRKAAEQGDVDAQSNLGRCYYNGEGTTKNLPEAVKWFRMAAEQGNAAAQHNLGICYYHGEGTAKNLPEAVKWFRMAAEQGHADAQFNLGVCCYDGAGTTKNLQEAVKWFRMAAEQGDADALQCLEEIKARR